MVVAEENINVVNILRKAGVSVAILGICACEDTHDSCDEFVREYFPIFVFENASVELFSNALRSLFDESKQKNSTERLFSCSITSKSYLF